MSPFARSEVDSRRAAAGHLLGQPKSQLLPLPLGLLSSEQVEPVRGKRSFQGTLSLFFEGIVEKSGIIVESNLRALAIPVGGKEVGVEARLIR